MGCTPLFCDTFDAQAKAYCKRLRVVCEHYKEPKLPADTVCGFPLVTQVFTETGQYCCVPRGKCSAHVGWERLRSANIDIERYRHVSLFTTTPPPNNNNNHADNRLGSDQLRVCVHELIGLESQARVTFCR